jgi:hypothetical protein
MKARAFLLAAFALASASGSCHSSSPAPLGQTSTFQPDLIPNSATPVDAGGEPTVVAEVAGVQDMLGQIQRAVAANTNAFTQVDIEDLDDLLVRTLVHAESPGGRGVATQQCVDQSIRNDGFTTQQSSLLCEDSLFDPEGCARQAFTVAGFDRDASIFLCQTDGSPETATCAQTVFATLGFSREQAVLVCADRDGAVVPGCVSTAFAAEGFSRDQTVALCAHRGSTDTANCATAAFATFGFSRDEAVALCANRGTVDTANCAASAFVTFGFSRAEAVFLCSNRGMPATASCAGFVFTTLGVSRAEAIEACRRREPEVIGPQVRPTQPR